MKKIKVIDYKKARDEALDTMIYFKKLGNEKMALAYLNLAAHIQSIRTEIDPLELPKNARLI